MFIFQIAFDIYLNFVLKFKIIVYIQIYQIPNLLIIKYSEIYYFINPEKVRDRHLTS